MGDKGQNHIEYVGLVVVAAMIIIALVGSGLAERVSAGFTTATCRITSAPPQDCGDGSPSGSAQEPQRWDGDGDDSPSPRPRSAEDQQRDRRDSTIPQYQQQRERLTNSTDNELYLETLDLIDDAMIREYFIEYVQLREQGLGTEEALNRLRAQVPALDRWDFNISCAPPDEAWTDESLTSSFVLNDHLDVEGNSVGPPGTAEYDSNLERLRREFPGLDEERIIALADDDYEFAVSVEAAELREQTRGEGDQEDVLHDIACQGEIPYVPGG